jgi:circadian clock protein KaiC
MGHDKTGARPRGLVRKSAGTAAPRSLRRQANIAAERKAATGIAGLDEAMQGGLPRGKATLVFGGPGAGKTVLALQALVHGAAHGNEPGIFVAFEEDARRIVANAATFGWDLATLQRRRLFFLDARLHPDVVQAGRFDLSAILAGLSLKVRQLGARRLVFDGIDVLLTLLDNPAAERLELHRIQTWLLEHDLTGIITAKADGDDPYSQGHYGYTAYMADCALHLVRRHQRAVSEREVTILKYRGSGFAENRAPFVIGQRGIEVAEQGNAAHAVKVAAKERLSTGVPGFDEMLRGGYFRASSALITGLPGTAKSTLCGAFVHAACRRGERALYVSFDELAVETVRNLASVGLQLQPFLDSGLLRMESFLSMGDSAEVQLMRVRAAIVQQGASCVVIDPISALAKSSDSSVALRVLARFIHWAKVNGVTLVCTSLLSSPDPQLEATDLGVSTLSDTWIQLAYAQRGGERNRSITIIKSRGTGHSNQVRELILGDGGISLAEVYRVGGEVLMGTMRWQQENLHRDEERRRSLEARRIRLDLEREQADIVARAQALQRQLEANRSALKDAQSIEAERVTQGAHRQEEMILHRMGERQAEPASSPRRARRKPGRGAGRR